MKPQMESSCLHEKSGCNDQIEVETKEVVKESTGVRLSVLIVEHMAISQRSVESQKGTECSVVRQI